MTNDALWIFELRRGVQQMFMGLASLSKHPDHRKVSRDWVYDTVSKLRPRVRGQQGEVLENVNSAIESALDDIQNFDLEVTEKSS